MPGFDGAGPQGQGPMTGRGNGLCNPKGSRNGSYGYPQPFSRGSAYSGGRMSRWGFGLGRGRRKGRGAGFLQGRGRRWT